MDSRLYTANLEFLSQNFPELAKLISQSSFPSSFKSDIIIGKKGYPTVRVNPERRWIFLHSQYDPVEEASRWAAAHPPTPGVVVVFIGWGLGYQVFEWLQRYRQSVAAALIVEPEPELFRASLEAVDIQILRQIPRIEILVGMETGAIYRRLQKYVSYTLSGELMLLPMPFAAIYPESIREAVQKEISQFQNSQTQILRHMEEMGYLCQSHIIRNLTQTKNGWFPREIKNCAADQPAIIVAAGPSLDRNIDKLPSVEDRAWIFAVDTGFRILKHYGIPAAVVVSKDPTEKNRTHFHNIHADFDTILAFDPQVHPEIPAHFSGKKIFLPNRNRRVHQWIMELGLQPEDEMPHSTNVALAAFNLAVKLGCNPIIFVGLDLCFSTGTGSSHAAFSALAAQTRFFEDQKCITYQSGELEETVEALQVEGIDGIFYPTTPTFYESLRLLESLIQQSGATCIDATEGGAKIAGTKIMTLEKAIHDFCTKKIHRENLFKKSPPQRSPEKISSSLRDIAGHLEQCGDLAETALTQIPSDINNDSPLLLNLQNIRNRIEKQERIYAELESALERILVEVYRPNFWDEKILSSELLHQRYVWYFTEIRRACREFAPLYRRAADDL